MASRYTSREIDNNFKKFYNSLSTVIVSTTSGATVTLSKDGEVLTAIEKNGKWTFHPTSFGVWQANAQLGQTSATPATIDIKSIGIDMLSLSFD